MFAKQLINAVPEALRQFGAAALGVQARKWLCLLPLMEWSGRAPALPAANAGTGHRGQEHAMSRKLDDSPAVIGIDIGKNSFHIVGLSTALKSFDPTRQGRRAHNHRTASVGASNSRCWNAWLG